MNGTKIIDEVLVSYFKGPRSFTAEDTVEINCHGGVFVTNTILDLVVKSGARLALPGEFTKRAFLNGRIDLSRAEAVMDVISSESSLSLKASVSLLKGSVYETIVSMRNVILYEIAFIESALDDPEHISLDGYPDRLSKVLEDLFIKLDKLILSSGNGRIIKDGIRTVILGKPNVGKSSLLNVLSGYDRAIVTDIAGTTRDVIEEKIHLGDINLCIVDTAGIRKTDDVVESIGVSKALDYAQDADLLIYVVDSSTALDENDKDIIDFIQDKKCVVLYNKTDLSSKITVEELSVLLKDVPIIKTSTLNETGIDALQSVIENMFSLNEIDSDNEIIITNLRHKEALVNARDALKLVRTSLDNGMPEDFYSIDLMSAYASLGNIIGEEVSDDLVNEIFSKFCMGK